MRGRVILLAFGILSTLATMFPPRVAENGEAVSRGFLFWNVSEAQVLSGRQRLNGQIYESHQDVRCRIDVARLVTELLFLVSAASVGILLMSILSDDQSPFRQDHPSADESDPLAGVDSSFSGFVDRF